MWLGHSIEHLVCIGGELEHHQPSPPRPGKTEQCARADHVVQLHLRDAGMSIGQSGQGAGVRIEHGMRPAACRRIDPVCPSAGCG